MKQGPFCILEKKPPTVNKLVLLMIPQPIPILELTESLSHRHNTFPAWGRPWLGCTMLWYWGCNIIYCSFEEIQNRTKSIILLD